MMEEINLGLGTAGQGNALDGAWYYLFGQQQQLLLVLN
jgi:hypothetical protein